MLNNLKIPLLIGASCFCVWWFFLADGQKDATEGAYTRPEYEEDASTIYYDMGRLALARRDYQAAVNFFTDAATVNTSMLSAYDSLGQTLETMQQPGKALAAYAQALHINPNFSDVRLQPGMPVPARVQNELAALGKARTWQGEPLQDKTIYVYAEKNLSDTIMFCRFLTGLGSQAEQVYFKPQPELLKLMRDAQFPNVTLVDNETDLALLPCNYVTSLLSLPHFAELTYERLNSEQEAYLHISQEQLNTTATLLSKKTFNIGIVWNNESAHASTKNYPVALSGFYPLATLPNVQLYSLQKGAATEQLATATRDGISIINLEKQLTDLPSTAALIASLDLVIGVDSLEIQLSGALGQQTWMLTPYLADWRWLTTGEGKTRKSNNSAWYSNSVWYKKLLKIQQPVPGSWDSVFAEIYQRAQQTTQKKQLSK